MFYLLKRFFCKHDYKKIEFDNFILVGWRKCIKCGKEKYFQEDCQFTHFKLGEFIIKN